MSIGGCGPSRGEEDVAKYLKEIRRLIKPLASFPLKGGTKKNLYQALDHMLEEGQKVKERLGEDGGKDAPSEAKAKDEERTGRWTRARSRTRERRRLSAAATADCPAEELPGPSSATRNETAKSSTAP